MKRSPLNKRSPKRSAVEEKDRHWRDSVFIRDHYRCRKCGTPYGLDPHHIRTKAAHPELRHVLDNGIALCRKCHGWAHANPKDFLEWLTKENPC